MPNLPVNMDRPQAALAGSRHGFAAPAADCVEHQSAKRSFNSIHSSPKIPQPSIPKPQRGAGR